MAWSVNRCHASQSDVHTPPPPLPRVVQSSVNSGSRLPVCPQSSFLICPSTITPQWLHIERLNLKVSEQAGAVYAREHRRRWAVSA